MIYLFINYVDFINKFCFISIINIFFYYNLLLIQIINFYLVNYLKLKKTKKKLSRILLPLFIAYFISYYYE